MPNSVKITLDFYKYYFKPFFCQKKAILNSSYKLFRICLTKYFFKLKVKFEDLDPDPDPAIKTNADPCGSGSSTLTQ
jgi:hypothetical protein